MSNISDIVIGDGAEITRLHVGFDIEPETLIRVAVRFLAGFPIPTSLASAARIFFFPKHRGMSGEVLALLLFLPILRETDQFAHHEQDCNNRY